MAVKAVGMKDVNDKKCYFGLVINEILRPVIIGVVSPEMKRNIRLISSNWIGSKYCAAHTWINLKLKNASAVQSHIFFLAKNGFNKNSSIWNCRQLNSSIRWAEARLREPALNSYGETPDVPISTRRCIRIKQNIRSQSSILSVKKWDITSPVVAMNINRN